MQPWGAAQPPVAPSPQEDGIGTAASEPAGGTRGQAPFRLLVVDDEAGIRELLATMLVEEGYEILTAEDGLQALDVLAQFRPHLVVTDLSMPRMSGLELLQVMRERFPGLPVVVVSGEFADDEPHPEIVADAVFPKGGHSLARLGATINALLSTRAA